MIELNDDDDEVVEEKSIKEILEEKRGELEKSLAVVKKALNLLGGNDQGEEIVRAVNDALGL